LPGEVDHVYDPVESPVDVVADHHAGFARAVSRQDTYPVSLHISWFVYLGGPIHRPLSPCYQASTKGYYVEHPENTARREGGAYRINTACRLHKRENFST
jgi:hypothetical protein